jgi:hypothetical protein
MKKLLALVLAMALVFGTVSFAVAAPADVVGTEYEDAATKLGALGVMIGDERGFRPNDSITRAEFAVLVVRALGLEAAAKFSTSPTKFADVTDAYSWAWGYINVAVEQGVIKGYSETAFGPGDAVTYEQAIAMIVRALGYEPAVVGGYPAGYLAKAAELDITDDVKVVAGAGAPRGAVAQMLANSLEVKLMERTAFGDEKKYEAVEKTLLEDKIGVTKVGGTVDAVDDDEITIDDETYSLAEGVDTKGVVGAVVTAWKYDGDIVYVDADTKIVYDYVVSNTADVTKMELKFAEKTYKVKDDATIYLDGAEQTLAGTSVDGLADAYGKIILDDGRVIYADLYVVDTVEFGIVVDVDAEDEVIEYYVDDPDTVSKLRLEDQDVTVIKDNKAADIADIEEGDVISVYKDTSTDPDTYVLAVSSAKVEGTLAAAKVDGTNYKVKVEGSYYKVLSGAYLSTDAADSFGTIADLASFDDFLGEEVTVYKNYAGNGVYVVGDIEETTNTFYGIVTKVWSTDKDYIKIFKEDGEVVSYEVDLDTGSDVAYGASLDDDQSVAYKFTVDKDGVITLIDNVDDDTIDTVNALVASIGDRQVKAFDKDDDSITVTEANDDGSGGVATTDVVYYVTSKTKFFDYTEGTIADLDIVAWEDIEGNDDVDALEFNFAANDKGELLYVVFTDGLDSIGTDDTYYAFVTDMAKTASDKYTLTLETKTDEVEVVFADDKLSDGTDSAAVDMVVEYKLLNDGTGEIVNAFVVADTEYGSYTVTGKDGTSFIKLGTTWYKVDSKVLVYDNASDNTEFVKASLGDIAVGDDVDAVIVNNVVKALIITAFN